MNKIFLALASASVLSFACISHAQEAAPASDSASVPLTGGQAKMARIQNKADYKAAKDEAAAKLKRANAACIADTAHSQSDCRAAARAQAKKDLADADLARAQKEAEIRSNTQ